MGFLFSGPALYFCVKEAVKMEGPQIGSLDQARTGRFIQQLRKELGLTQRQLGEKLMISDKTVSKWECGSGLPEISLLMPLCRELGVNVNELLSGQRLSAADYQRKAEENIMSLMKEREESIKKIRLSVFGVSTTATLIILVLLVGFYAGVMSLPVKLLVIGFACLQFGAGLYVTMSMDKEAGYFKCKACGETFKPTWRAYLWAPHTITRRWLRCPKCGRVTACRHVMSRGEPDGQER